jgi:hypothetical protein
MKLMFTGEPAGFIMPAMNSIPRINLLFKET